MKPRVTRDKFTETHEYPPDEHGDVMVVVRQGKKECVGVFTDDPIRLLSKWAKKKAKRK